MRAAESSARSSVGSVLWRARTRNCVRSRASMKLASPPPHRTSILKGAVLMALGAGIMFPLLNTCAKLLSPRYPIVEIVWARFAGHLLFFIVLFLPSRGPLLLVTHRPDRKSTRLNSSHVK